MNTENYIEELLVKFFSGIASEEEKNIIENWRAESRENKNMFLEYKKTWTLWDDYSLMKTVDVDKAHKKVKNKINKKQSKRKFANIYMIAASLILPLLLLTGFFLREKIANITLNQFSQEIITSEGVRKTITMPDGTRVILNSRSSLKLPLRFTNNKREVTLEGEAYFNVKTDKNAPFYVNTGEVTIKATGTSFNINAYTENDDVETTLIDGKLSMITGTQNKKQTLASLKPDQHAVYNKKNNKVTLYSKKENQEKPKQEQKQKNNIQKDKSTPTENKEGAVIPIENIKKYVGWKEGMLIFHNDPMNKVAQRLEKWYNVNIVLQDSLLYDYKYTATFKNENIDQILELLKLTAPLDYTIQSRKKTGPHTYAKRKITIKYAKQNQ